MFNISPVGVTLIKSSEGFVPHVYSDNGVPAIAYGHRLRSGESFPNGVTEPEGSDILDRDIDLIFAPMVNAHVPAECNQQQFDALCSFVYNVKNQPSSLVQLLSHGWDQVAVQFLRWCHVRNPKTQLEEEDPGLLARRKREAALFLS
jgi:lysozyme